MVIIEMNEIKLTSNKAIFLGICISDKSKFFLYDFHKIYIKNKLRYKAKLLYSETDS